MPINAYSILVILSVLVVLSYIFNYLARILKIPSVLLLIGAGIGLKYGAGYLGLSIPATTTLLQILGVTGLIFVVLEAALDLEIDKHKLPLIGRAFLSALVLLAVTSGLIALLFYNFYDTTYSQALVHAIPLSVMSSAIAIPSVQNISLEKKEFIIYESTFSDILGIMAFNYLILEHGPGVMAVLSFSWDIILIVVISILSSAFLVFLLNRATSNVRFFLTFAILILAYSLAKFIHLPSLILVLFFGVVLNNFRLFDYPIVHRFLNFSKLADITKEMKMMTAETAFIIRTFFFLVFGFSMNLILLQSREVLIVGAAILGITLVLRFIFLRFLLHIKYAPLTLIAPRGLITVLLFYSIPKEQRLQELSEGVLFIVIVSTGLMMTLGLLMNKQNPKERIEDVI